MVRSTLITALLDGEIIRCFTCRFFEQIIELFHMEKSLITWWTVDIVRWIWKYERNNQQIQEWDLTQVNITPINIHVESSGHWTFDIWFTLVGLFSWYIDCIVSSSILKEMIEYITLQCRIFVVSGRVTLCMLHEFICVAMLNLGQFSVAVEVNNGSDHLTLLWSC